MSGPKYEETCFECDGWNVTLRFIEKKHDVEWFQAVCRDCGTEWIDNDA
jgi:hypothetical protein